MLKVTDASSGGNRIVAEGGENREMRVHGPFSYDQLERVIASIRSDDRDQVVFKADDGSYYVLECAALDRVNSWFIADENDQITLDTPLGTIIGTVFHVDDEWGDGEESPNEDLIKLSWKNDVVEVEENNESDEVEENDQSEDVVEAPEPEAKNGLAPPPRTAGFSLRRG